MKGKILEKSEVMRHLREFNEQELFYQQYQNIHNDKETLDSFLQDYDKEDLKKKRIYIEECLPKAYKEFECETSMWIDQEKDIEIGKYSRFMPQISAVHDFFEIIYVLENDLTIELEKNSITLKAGDVCFIPPGMIHCPQIMENTIALQINIRKSTFKKEFFKSLKGNNAISSFFLNALYSQDNSSVLIFRIGQEEVIKDIFLYLYQENYNQCPGYQFIINNFFEIVLCFLLRCNPSKIEVNNVKQCIDTRITQILQYIQSNCEKVTITELSDEFNLSKTYLSKYITRKIGKPFSSILQEIRLEKACDMLHNSNLRIEDISNCVGYLNVEHFIRLFRKKYHKTPNQYRMEE